MFWYDLCQVTITRYSYSNYCNTCFFVYLDYILIFSRSKWEHVQHVGVSFRGFWRTYQGGGGMDWPQEPDVHSLHQTVDLLSGLLGNEDKVKQSHSEHPALSAYPNNRLLWRHSSELACHPVMARTRDAKESVATCQVSSQHKSSHQAPTGLLQPLPAPHQPWPVCVSCFWVHTCHSSEPLNLMSLTSTSCLNGTRRRWKPPAWPCLLSPRQWHAVMAHN